VCVILCGQNDTVIIIPAQLNVYIMYHMYVYMNYRSDNSYYSPGRFELNKAK